jgi:hypothetical protein
MIAGKEGGNLLVLDKSRCGQQGNMAAPTHRCPPIQFLDFPPKMFPDSGRTLVG